MDVNFDNPVQLENAAFELGLERTYAYHCRRCNYAWFPRDFDPSNLTEDPYSHFLGQNIFNLEAPKACARGKSTQWRKDPRRKSKHTPREDIFHDMLTIHRLRAWHRQGKL